MTPLGPRRKVLIAAQRDGRLRFTIEADDGRAVRVARIAVGPDEDKLLGLAADLVHHLRLAGVDAYTGGAPADVIADHQLHRHRGKVAWFSVDGARVMYCDDDACPGSNVDGTWAHRVRDPQSPPPPWSPPSRIP